MRPSFCWPEVPLNLHINKDGLFLRYRKDFPPISRLHLLYNKASQMIDNANATQRQASAAINPVDDFSHKSIQSIDDYNHNYITVMALEVEASQSEDFLNRVAQCEMEDGGWSAD